MSHTWEHGTTRFTGNSDLSGDIMVHDVVSGVEVSVPGRDILEFVADRVRSARISQLEQMDTSAILGVDV